MKSETECLMVEAVYVDFGPGIHLAFCTVQHFKPHNRVKISPGKGGYFESPPSKLGGRFDPSGIYLTCNLRETTLLYVLVIPYQRSHYNAN